MKLEERTFGTHCNHRSFIATVLFRMDYSLLRTICFVPEERKPLHFL